MNSCDVSADNVFGPRVDSCRDGFDFTLLFEQTIFSAIPSAAVIVASTGYIVYLSRQDVKTKPGATKLFPRLLKQIPLSCFALAQLALVVLWSRPSSGATTLSLPASALSMVAALALVVVSYLEHARSVRPSTILNAYLALSILFDLTQARTLWLRPHNGTVAAVFTTSLVLKLFVLGSEMIEKRQILKAPYSSYPPEALGGVLNRGVFWWINSLLLKGSSSTLRVDDLFSLDGRLKSDHISPRIRHHWQSSNKESKYGLIWVSLRCFWRNIVAIVVFRLCLVAFRLSQPLLIHRAVSLLEEPQSLDKANTGRALVGATALIYIGIALTTGAFRHNIYRLITMVRSGLITLIYDSTLNLDPGVAAESAALTLISTDVECIAVGFEVFDSLWADPIEISIATYLLYQQIGIAFIAPIMAALIFVAIPITLRRVTGTAQKEWLESIERRVASTASILSNMKGVKMTGLSERVGETLQQSRITELKVSATFRRILGLSVVIGCISTVGIPVATLITYVLIMQANGNLNLSPSLAFTALSVVSLLAYPIQNLARAIPQIAAGAGCFQRIQAYISNSDVATTKVPAEGDEAPVMGNRQEGTEMRWMPPIDVKEPLLVARNATFSFRTTDVIILRNINISLVPGTWTVITGPIGCGKSVLLLALLGELNLQRGTYDRQPFTDIGYCGQDPWLPNLGIRNIITAHSEFDETWYRTILNACVLNSDMNELPDGDKTVIGSNGASLSGGQKQRVSLAQALYARKPLLLLDDVLSGLDATTERAIVDNVFGNDGLVRKLKTSVLLATNSVRHARRADSVIVMGQGGVIVERGSPVDIKYLPDSDDESSKLQESGSATPHSDENTTDGTRTQGNDHIETMPEDDATIDRRGGDIRLYAYYFRSLGWILTVLMVTVVFTQATFQKIPTLWVRWWSEAEQRNPGQQTAMYAGIYALFGAICVLSLVAGVSMIFVFGIPRSSNMLHAKLVRAVSQAPYWFFVTTDTGEIINRFSQDMSLLCLQLPIAFLDTLFNSGVCIVGAILITMASKYSLAIYPALMVILYVLEKFYLRTSRQMRLLDIESKAPLYSNFLETLKGITTIKAFGWQSASMLENAALLDRSQRPFYLMYSIQRWLNLVLDLLVARVATLIVAIATSLQDSSAGALGVSLLNILTFSQDLTYLIRSWTDLETSLGAVTRIRSFERDTPCEHAAQETTEPAEDWPSRGVIEFKHLSSNYRAGMEPVLKDISLEISPGSKVGICGRTGSGKSTFILTILRLAEIQNGDILIDGTTLKTTHRNRVRQGTIAVPQDPLLLPGTIRFNADPFSEHSDESILSVLEEVGVLDIISARGGLDTNIDSIPFSHGQRQLFCLTRAILSKSRIVVLDEMTSNVDAATEAKMMELVDKEFVDRTIIAVAHHLHTIRHFDMIVVLDQGRVVETGSPDELLTKQSAFRELWDRQK